MSARILTAQPIGCYSVDDGWELELPEDEAVEIDFTSDVRAGDDSMHQVEAAEDEAIPEMIIEVKRPLPVPPPIPFSRAMTAPSERLRRDAADISEVNARPDFDALDEQFFAEGEIIDAENRKPPRAPTEPSEPVPPSFWQRITARNSN